MYRLLVAADSSKLQMDLEFNTYEEAASGMQLLGQLARTVRSEEEFWGTLVKTANKMKAKQGWESIG